VVGSEKCDAGNLIGCLDDCSGPAENYTCSDASPSICTLS